MRNCLKCDLRQRSNADISNIFATLHFSSVRDINFTRLEDEIQNNFEVYVDYFFFFLMEIFHPIDNYGQYDKNL